MVSNRRFSGVSNGGEGIMMDKHKVLVNGREFDYDAVVNLMDDDLREQLNSIADFWGRQKFVDEYCHAHLEKFDEEFVVN
jgi:hypothetical protein